MSDPKHIPTDSELEAAGTINVFDSKGGLVPFSSIYADQKTIVIFIRHFFCGRCQAYVEELSKISQETLDRSKAKLVVVGCGEWQAIKSYAENTKFKGDIFAEPSREIYRALNMIENLAATPAGEEKRSYATQGTASVVFSSIWRGPLKNPSLIGKQGNIHQLGGEFIFGPGNTCSFASRMQHTEDHIEVADLLKAAGAAES